MDWLSKVEPIKFDPEEIMRIQEMQLKPFRIEPIELASVDKISELAILFVAGCVLGSESTMVSLPTRNDCSRTKILEEVAPHFTDIKLIWRDNQLDNINMQHMKEESKQLFLNSDVEMIEIVRDLYRTTDLTNPMHSLHRPIQHYHIDEAAIETLQVNHTESMKEYICREFMHENEELVFLPSGWYLSDALKESIFLRFIAGFVPTVHLLADQDNKVIAIECKNLTNRCWNIQSCK